MLLLPRFAIVTATGYILSTLPTPRKDLDSQEPGISVIIILLLIILIKALSAVDVAVTATQ
jgi:membrane protein DedA with SNARE-associated domain